MRRFCADNNNFPYDNNNLVLDMVLGSLWDVVQPINWDNVAKLVPGFTPKEVSGRLQLHPLVWVSTKLILHVILVFPSLWGAEELGGVSTRGLSVQHLKWRRHASSRRRVHAAGHGGRGRKGGKQPEQNTRSVREIKYGVSKDCTLCWFYRFSRFQRNEQSVILNAWEWGRCSWGQRQHCSPSKQVE